MNRHATAFFFWLVSMLAATGLASFMPLKEISDFNQTRMLELILLFWISAAFLLSPACRSLIIGKIGWTKPAFIALALAFWLLGFLSAMQATWPTYALKDWAHYLLLMLTIFTVASIAGQNLRLATKILLIGLTLGISLALARFMIQLVLTLSLEVVEPLTQWWMPYSNPRFIAQAIVWILPLLTALPALWPLYRTRSVIAAHALCIGVWLLLFWSGSRAEILALILGMVFLATLIRSRAFSFITRMSFHALAGCGLWILTSSLVVIQTSEQISSQAASHGPSITVARTTTSGREWLIERSLQLVAQHPILGVGPDHFSLYNTDPVNRLILAHPHNLILQIAVEWGLPAVTIFAFLLWTFIYRRVQLIRSQSLAPGLTDDIRQTLGIPLLLTLFAVLLTSLLDGIHIMPLSLLLGVPILGLIIAATPLTVQGPVTQSRSGHLLSIAILLSCWVLILQNILRNPDCLTYPIEAERILGHGEVDNPRFWSQGRIPLTDGCLETGRYVNGRDTLKADAVDAPSRTEQY